MGQWPARGLGAIVTGTELGNIYRPAPLPLPFSPKLSLPTPSPPPLPAPPPRPPPLLRRPSLCPCRATPSLLLWRSSPRPHCVAPPPPLPRLSPHRTAVPSHRCPWLRQRLAATPSAAILALALPWSPPAASASLCLAPLHRRPRPALSPSTADVPPAPIEPDSPRGASGTPRPPHTTSVVGRATAGPDLRLDLRPSSADPER
ncbi:proline-rich receptor-like protein kinase PERK14 [Miscanthus floridulus]|uniref:proline-rich receptor-like protein kinase PERK14 n=1 Tax=Miscanthus floridulus TaxID=154761 RepID=UPI003459E34B